MLLLPLLPLDELPVAELVEELLLLLGRLTLPLLLPVLPLFEPLLLLGRLTLPVLLVPLLLFGRLTLLLLPVLPLDELLVVEPVEVPLLLGRLTLPLLFVLPLLEPFVLLPLETEPEFAGGLVVWLMLPALELVLGLTVAPPLLLPLLPPPLLGAGGLSFHSWWVG